MRYSLSFGLACWFLAVGSLQAGDGKKMDKEKDKGSYIAEIGGKTLEEWIKEINHRDPGRRATAISTVMMFGPVRAYQALPAILEQLGKHSTSYPLDVSVRVNAATALGLIIGSAKDTEPKHVRESVKLLTRLLTDNQAIVKYRAAQALGRIGVEAKDSITYVMALLSGDRFNHEVRQAAATTLGLIAIDKDKGPPLNVLHALFRGLEDPAAQVRVASIQSLTWLGAPADIKGRDSLVRALEQVASKDVEPMVQIWAHMAVMSVLHSVTPERIAPVAKMLSHAEVPVRLQAAQALGTIGPKAKSGIPGLVACLADKDPNVIMVSIWALGRMEDSAFSAVPLLQRLTAPSQPEPIQEAAKEAIKQISGKKK